MENEKLIITERAFDCFNVYQNKNDHTFLHIEVEDNPIFYGKLFDYFFDENKLIQYMKNKKDIIFEPSQSNFITLYNSLQKFIDEEHFKEEINKSEFEESFIAILEEEGLLKDEYGKTFIRKDKIGKIGEYIFCSILSGFFNFDCILPKIQLISNLNMSVYGIDALFYSCSDDLLLFGESKFTINLSNGISQINESIKKYETMLSNEYYCILRNDVLSKCQNKFPDRFGNIADVCLNMKTFIEKANIQKIGIPLFIAHGKEFSPDKIIERLKKINKQNFFNIETIYYSISLPIINKETLCNVFTAKIIERIKIYESKCK